MQRHTWLENPADDQIVAVMMLSMMFGTYTMNRANTTPTNAGIGEDRAMPMPAPRMNAAMAMDLPRKPFTQLSSVVYMVWNSVPVVPARAVPAKRTRQTPVTA